MPANSSSAARRAPVPVAVKGRSLPPSSSTGSAVADRRDRRQCRTRAAPPRQHFILDPAVQNMLADHGPLVVFRCVTVQRGGPATGFRTPRYELRGHIGAGAMGTVDRAWDRQLLIEVALKRLFARTEAEQLYLLKQEFRALRDISHPNLARLYELDVSEEGCFFTMELVEGTDFVSFIREEWRRPTRPHEAPLRDATLQLVEGLCAIHGAGKVHRDVKPSNVLVDRSGRVVLVDFGLVKDVASFSGATNDHEVAGTFAYMAPELLLGCAATPAVDWYSVGVMLFEAITGRLPFGGTPAEVFERKQRAPAFSPTDLGPSMPPAFIEIIHRLLDPRPETRGEAQVLRDALHDLRAPSIAPGPPPAPEPLFVGRTTEMAALDAALTAVQAGQAAVMHVQGPSGIGKSELVRRLLRRVGADTVVLSGRCHLRETVPHQALDAIVDELSRRLLHEPDDTVRAVAPRHAAALLRLFPVLGRVPALTAAPSLELAVELPELRRQGIQALRELLARLADRQTIIVWVDDAQWGDGDSAALLRELLRPPDAPRVLIVLSYRNDEAANAPLVTATSAEDRVPHHHIVVAPLDDADTRALAAALLQTTRARGDLGPIVDAVVEESGGSPFFAGELARLARLHKTRGDAIVRSAPTVADVIEARLEVLGASSRALLELVAVAGRPIGSVFALDLAGLGQRGRRMLMDLSAQSLLRMHASGDAERLEVYHDRIRDALVNGLSAVDLRSVHRQLADGAAADV